MLRTLAFLCVCSGLALGCLRSQRPRNSDEFYTANEIAEGTTVSYVCERGYELLGPPQRTCQSNGTWTPTGLPYCVMDIAKGKPFFVSSTLGTVVRNSLGCYRTKLKRLHFWYVDLKSRYNIQILRVEFGNQSASSLPVSLEFRVGDHKGKSMGNHVCSKFAGALPFATSIDLPCAKPLHGSYVLVRGRSHARFSMSICRVRAFSEQAMPLREDPVATVQEKQHSKRRSILTIVMVFAAAVAVCGIGTLVAGVLSSLVRASCKILRRSEMQFGLTSFKARKFDETTVTLSANAEPTFKSSCFYFGKPWSDKGIPQSSLFSVS